MMGASYSPSSRQLNRAGYWRADSYLRGQIVNDLVLPSGRAQLKCFVEIRPLKVAADLIQGSRNPTSAYSAVENCQYAWAD